jgi:DNA-binding transcriptional ArsR family regulator
MTNRNLLAANQRAGEVFVALAEPTRWRLLGLIASRGGGTATTLAAEVMISRPAVVKHLAVLDRAGLVEGRRRGREVRYTVRTEPLASTGRWLTNLAEDWDQRLAAIKRIAESAEGSGDDSR